MYAIVRSATLFESGDYLYMARRFPIRYGELEEAILQHLYLNPNPRPSHTTYNLAGVLRQQQIKELLSGSDEWRAEIRAAHSEVQRAIESLILQRLIKGDRERDDKMVHFTNLKLTPKGQAEAIRLKRELEAAEISLLVANSVAEDLIQTTYAHADDSVPPPQLEFLVKPSFIPPGLVGDCTISLLNGSDRWWKLYRSEELAWTEARDMGLINDDNARGEAGNLATHPLLRALVPEVGVDPAELKRRGFRK